MAFSARQLVAHKHFKLALLIAPVLVIIGYIASDYYLASQTQAKIYPLTIVQPCNLLAQGCQLYNGDVKVNIRFHQGAIEVSSNYPLHVLSFLLAAEQSKEFKASLAKSVNQAKVKVPLLAKLKNSEQPVKLRMVMQLANGFYLAEWTF